MDDELKLKIAASLDLAADAQADADVVRAMADDPAVEAWARGLHTVDHALRRWPERKRGEKSWDRLAERIRKRLDEKPAKARGGAAVSASDADPTAFPVFDDDTVPPMEHQTAMSETNEHDADLEGLAALTRTSQVPGAMPSTPPRSLGPALIDAPDDTSSGLVDMKTLAQATREAAASIPPAAPAPAAAPAKDEKPKPIADLVKATEKTDVAAKPKAAAAAAAPVVIEPVRKGGNTWLGALGGMAVATAAFLIYSKTQTPSVDDAARTLEPSAATAPAAPAESARPESAPTPAAEAPAPAPQAAPTPSAAPEPAPAPPPAPVAAAPAPEPAPATREVERAARSRTAAREEPARPAAPPAAPPPAAAAAPAARTAPTPAAQPAPTTAARPAATGNAAPTTAPARPSSVDDLINRAAGGPAQAAAPAAPAAAAPAAEVPERLTRPQITTVLTPLNGAVRACAQGQTGTAPVAIVIGSDGAVRSAAVSGQFAGSEVGTCIEGVVRRARFPQFRAAQVNVTWPFVILPPR